MHTITRLASVHCHGKSRADWKLAACPLKPKLRHILGVESYSGDEDISATLLCVLVSNLVSNLAYSEIQ